MGELPVQDVAAASGSAPFQGLAGSVTTQMEVLLPLALVLALSKCV